MRVLVSITGLMMIVLAACGGSSPCSDLCDCVQRSTGSAEAGRQCRTQCTGALSSAPDPVAYCRDRLNDEGVTVCLPLCDAFADDGTGGRDGGGPGGPPGSWTCSETYYGTGDGCDCGCGATDPDCPGGVGCTGSDCCDGTTCNGCNFCWPTAGACSE